MTSLSMSTGTSMEHFELWQIVLTLFSICGVVIAPSIWYFQHTTSKLEQDNEKIINKLENSNLDSFKGIKEDLKDFRTHFDSKISEVYIAVDNKNRELKDIMSKELEFIRVHISTIDHKLDETRERTHEIEKDLLRLQSTIGRDYITKDDLQDFIRNRRDSH
jgi:hypothetical protein